MCGIAGLLITDKAHRDAISSDEIERMSSTMAHRGPDDAGTYIDSSGRLALGFRRLSIIDLSGAGHQPMTNEDGTVWIVFNGEIYNHAELRSRLAGLGHVYRSKTDTETIIHLYEQYGVDCVRHLNGMFGFAIWDERKRRLFIARDRIGIKPLYYYHNNGIFAFASEISSLLELSFVRTELNAPALYHFLTFGATPAPMTLFANINKLANGHFIEIDLEGGLREGTYWTPIVERHEKHYSLEEAGRTVSALLHESVEARMMSDVPLGMFLSGGIDSTTNLALMTNFVDRPINTFSVGFQNESEFNEFDFVDLAVKRFETQHHEVRITEQDFWNFLPRSYEILEEPVFQPVSIPQYFLSKLMRDHGVIVTHVGEGSDELFAGYDWYFSGVKSEEKAQRLRSLCPAFIFRLLSKAIGNVHKINGSGKLSYNLSRLASGEPIFLGSDVVCGEILKRSLLSSDYLKSCGDIYSPDVIEGYYQEVEEANPGATHLEKMVHAEFRFRLPEKLLLRVDRITMACSLEARVPFLDHKIVEFVMGLPHEVKFHPSIGKFLLKKIVRGLIPDQIIDRPKQGFSVPLPDWVLRKRRAEVSSVIHNSKLFRSGIFDITEIDRLFDRAAEPGSGWEVASPLFLLFSLALWYDLWIAR